MSVPNPRPRRLLIAVALLGGLLLVGSLVQWRSSSRPSSRPTSASAGTQKPGEVVRFEAKTEKDPKDWQAWAELGSAYVTAARVAAEPAYYPRAERALKKSLDLNDGQDNWQARAGQGALAAGRHDFANALVFAEQGAKAKPGNQFIQGIIVDSLTELGRYPEAVAAAQQMVDLKPNFASFARVSYQRELHGDIGGAIEAFESALQAAGTTADKAFALYYLGELEFNRKNLEAAERHYGTTLKIDPTAMQALAGIGKIKAARGDRAGAVSNFEKAVAGFPDPELIKELAELYTAEGRPKDAAKRYRLMEQANLDQQKNGVDINLEIALSSADRKADLDRGLAAARKEWDLRKSIHVADALGWQLFAHQQYEEAIGYADQALKLGTRNAGFYFHRAEINKALGKKDAAEADYQAARDINPYFSFLYEDRLK